MERPYFIEIRMMEESKEITKKIIYNISKKFNVQGQTRKKVVPHITLFGPFNTKSIHDVIGTIGEIGSKYSSLEYEIDGFDYFEFKKKFLFITTNTKKNVIFLKVIPSEDLKNFRFDMAKKLLKFCDAVKASHDSKDKFKFHATLAMKDIHYKFDEIWDYLMNYEIKFKLVTYRVTLLNQGKIMFEYDFPSKRLLNRRQVLGEKTTSRSDRRRFVKKH